jgi:quinol monooxygenase YgiN
MLNQAKIVAILVAKPGKTEDLKALLNGMVAACRAEPANLRWDVWQDQADPNRFVLDELYQDNAGVTAHRETPHFKNYLAHIGDLADRTAMVLNPVQVA